MVETTTDQQLADVRAVAEWMGWKIDPTRGPFDRNGTEMNIHDSRDAIALVEGRLRAEGHGSDLFDTLWEIVCGQAVFAPAAQRTAACARVIRELEKDAS